MVFIQGVSDKTTQLFVAGESLSVSLVSVISILMTPTAIAWIEGLFRLFLMLSARKTDIRLKISGANVIEIYLAREFELFFATSLAVVVFVVVLSINFVPENIMAFVTASLIIGLIYGGIGALVGLVFNKLVRSLHNNVFTSIGHVYCFESFCRRTSCLC